MLQNFVTFLVVIWGVLGVTIKTLEDNKMFWVGIILLIMVGVIIYQLEGIRSDLKVLGTMVNKNINNEWKLLIHVY